MNEQGLPLAEQAVDFSLSSGIGGVALNVTQAKSNDEGEVSVQVNAGTVPTIVRVNASVESLSGDTIQTQSEAIAITTGLPNQYSFSLASDVKNVEGLNRDGEEVNFTARLADTFGNPVPDNTVVNFTTEGGQIESNCLTVNGACSVLWTSANPRVNDGIITILATAIGHETLFDSNGNNVYDIDDGEAIDDTSDAGLFVAHPTGTQGFIDVSEAWRDDNDNNQWDTGEIFLDYNNNQSFDLADGLFNGLQCTHPSLCGQNEAATMHVRKSNRIIMSGSNAIITILSDGTTLASNAPEPDATPITAIARNQKQEFSVLIADINGNIMPANTSISVTSSGGELEVLTGESVQNIYSTTPSKLTFTLTNNVAEGEPSEQARLSVTVTTPSEKETVLTFNIELQ